MNDLRLLAASSAFVAASRLLLVSDEEPQIPRDIGPPDLYGKTAEEYRISNFGYSSSSDYYLRDPKPKGRKNEPFYRGLRKYRRP